ncbi:MAG TPA: hypothetical protein VIY48_11985 [Candidatus Paceibacterota bacterium]
MVAKTRGTVESPMDEPEPNPVQVPDSVIEPVTIPDKVEVQAPTFAYVPGTVTDDGYYVPVGNIETVECPIIPGNLKVRYNTSVAFRIVASDYVGPGETPVEQECRRLCLFIAGFENWRMKDALGQIVPEPDPHNWESFLCIVAKNGSASELYGWLTGRGLAAALNQSMGNSAGS